ncbi:unnamed protein product [Oikopleura dioica]|uniref:Uncharacterized protein n=1 Tax=Oikopleura dioica TaxID=34765 RepID=E4XS07_OIKDI|nr:unnamed protein product [Oikopleura dioica]
MHSISPLKKSSKSAICAKSVFSAAHLRCVHDIFIFHFLSFFELLFEFFSLHRQKKISLKKMGNVLSGRQRNASSSTIGGKKRGESTSSRNQERRSPKMPYRLVLQICYIPITFSTFLNI